MKAAEVWNKFWFEPTSPSPVCVFRILYGILAFSNGLLWSQDFLVWFGRNGVVSVETIRHLEKQPTLSLLIWLNPSDTINYGLLILYLISALCLTVGFKTRTSIITTWLLMVSFHNRNPEYWHSGDLVLRLLGFSLIFAPAGAMFSLDSWLTKKDNPTPRYYSPWAQRLIQLFLSAIYFKAFWGKLGGYTWWEGTAVYYATHLHAWKRHSIPYVLDHLWTIKFLTWGTLLTELSLWSLIWVRECRYWVLLVGVIFHSTINWCLNIDLLEYAMVAAYINFIDPADLERVINTGKNLVSKAIHTVAAS